MDKGMMGFGAFLLVLGVMLVWAVPALFALQESGYSYLRISNPSDWVLAGAVIAPFGAAILAYGIGSPPNEGHKG